jgi:hypothetical protein
MMASLLLAMAHVDDVASGGPLTLVFPLVFVFVVFGLWWLAFRRFRGGP